MVVDGNGNTAASFNCGTVVNAIFYSQTLISFNDNNARIESLQGNISSLDNSVSILKGNVSELDNNISSLKER